MSERKNINRGYHKLIVWQDAADLYVLIFLNVALGSLGESISGIHVYRRADQIAEAGFEQLDTLAYKLENGLVRLIDSLQHKQAEGGWQDSFMLRESNAAYGERKDGGLE